jgi:GT2 family glycosyltransferase
MTCELKLSVIIVPHDGLFPLEPCLYALLKAANGLDAEIFLACGEPDGLPSRFAGITRPVRPQGMDDTRFVNRLIRQCRGEYILLLHPDTLIGEDSLRTLCCFMDEHADEAGAAGLKMLDPHGAFLPESRRRFPLPRALGYQLCGLARLFPASKRYAACEPALLNTTKLRRVDIVSEAFVMINRRALEQAGLPDEAFPFAFAYPDWLYRIAAAGYRNFYFPERMLHLGGEASRRGDRQQIRARYDALTLFCEKHFPRLRTVPLLIRLRKRLALLTEKRKPPHKPKRPRMLAICRDEHLAAIRAVVAAPALIQLNPDRRRPVDAAADRRFQMQAYTDIIFCYPDVTFDQILLFMNKMQAAITCHIYLPDDKKLVTYEPA